jgi:hypothetical protein
VHVHKVRMHGEVEVYFQTFLAMVLHAGEWLVPYPAHFSPGERFSVATNMVLDGLQGRVGHLRV